MRLVLCAEGPIEPEEALRWYLATFPPTPEDPVHLVFGTRRGEPPIDDPLPPGLSIGGTLPGRGLRALTSLKYHRYSYGELCSAIISGDFKPDVVLACCTTEDGTGTRSLGMINGYLQLAIDGARFVVLEEASWLPAVPGAAMARRWDHVVKASQAAEEDFTALSASFDDVDLGVARRVAALLPPAPSLALGVGRIIDALASSLGPRADVGYVSGAITSATRTLEDAGSLDPARPILATAIVGPQPLLEWAAANPKIRLLPSTDIHSPEWLSAHPRLIAVLGALSVDAAGNINSEQVNDRLVSGIGGAPDLAGGAHRSPGGMCIVALRSMTPAGKSRLSEELERISIPARDVDVIVTEHGAAILAGLSANDRAVAIRKVFPQPG